MIPRVLQTLILYYTVCAFAYHDDLFVNGQNAQQEMVEKGRTQYQLLREKGNLPRYGTCWKSAVEHLEEGCKHLSEDTQSDIAIHITNCFLEQSGHDTYNCGHDKKANLRAICISSMTDRAFHVYTEFYTHTQNICWFLRGQIWHETISESTFKVGQQLKDSARNQETLLKAQQDSIDIQNRILSHGKLLEQVLSDLYQSAKVHQEVLGILTDSVQGFQAWLMGEMSWFDSIVFYVVSLACVFIFTSVKRTGGCRLPVLMFLSLNLIIERLICFIFLRVMQSQVTSSAQSSYHGLICCVWYCRYAFVFINLTYLTYQAYHYRDLDVENNYFLVEVKKQNCQILEILRFVANSRPRLSLSDKVELVNEFSSTSNGSANVSHYDRCDSPELVPGKLRSPVRDLWNNNRYNLRSSKQNTPELN